MLTTPSLLLAALLAQSDAPEIQLGTWRAHLVSPGGAMPFGLKLSREQGELKAWILNEPEAIPIPFASIDGGKLVLDIAHYDSKITAAISDEGRSLAGEWVRRGPRSWGRMTFVATAGDGPRFEPLERAGKPADFSGRWKVQFDGDRDHSVGVFRCHADGRADGTFLTTLGDYRYLAGQVDGSTLRLSCFDGAHAFLFKARMLDDGTIEGDFWSRSASHQKWTARRDADVTLPNAYELTTWRSGDLAKLRYPDLDGKLRGLADPEFAGAARIFVVFGSWCPNCKDATRYLAELHRRYRDRGLSVLGLAFEFTGDLERDAKQVRRYAELQGAEYPMLIAGTSNKAEATKAFPVLDRVRSYPTTIFLNRDGGVHTVHTGFSGPATGEDYEALKRRFVEIVEELLASDAKR